MTLRISALTAAVLAAFTPHAFAQTDDVAAEVEAEATTATDDAQPAATEPAATDPTASEAAAPSQAPAIPTEPAASPSEPEVFLASQCASNDVASALSQARHAIARIEAPGASGLGFVFHSRDYVVTALSVVDRGRGIRVYFDGDERRDATVVAIDTAHDLAILELGAAAPAAPLSLAAAQSDVGDPVLAVGVSTNLWPGRKMHRREMKAHRRWHKKHAWRDGGGDTVIHPGVITSSSGERQRSNALDSRNLSWGAPILDCAGRVAGVATTPFSDEIASVERLRALEGEIADEEVYAGGWAMGHPHVGLLYQIDHQRNDAMDGHDQWLGISLGTALIGDDSWYFPLRFNASWLIGPDFEDPFKDRSGYRVGGHLGAGYRFMVKGGRVPIYLVPTIGGGVWYEKIKLETTLLSVAGPCEAATCAVQTTLLEETDDRWRVRPTAGLGVMVGFGELSYQFQLDTKEPRQSIHAITLGAQW